MVHLRFAALTTLLVATSAAATNTNTNANKPVINNLILSPVHSTSTITITIPDTGTHPTTTTTTDTTTPPAGCPLAHVVHKLEQTTATEVQHHRIVTPSEERTGPPTKTGPPFEETMHRGAGFGAAANIAHAANGAGGFTCLWWGVEGWRGCCCCGGGWDGGGSLSTCLRFGRKEPGL
jgi:hypothetical protein